MNYLRVIGCTLLSVMFSLGYGWAQVPASKEPISAYPVTESLQQGNVKADRPAPHRLTLSAGDLIEINILDEPDQSGKVRVSESGDVTLILGGRVHVEGLTADEARAAIEARLREGQFIQDPHVSVFVDEYAAEGVTVLGEVRNPGVYPLFGAQGLSYAIASAGGLTSAAANEITIIHKNDPDHPQIVELPPSLGPAQELGVQIQNGDKIVVSAAGVVYVLGEVGRPGGFVLARNEPSYTVEKVLSLAQGFTHVAKLNNSLVIRKTSAGILQYQIQISEILKGKEADMQLMAGDVLYVPSSTKKIIAYRSLEAIFTTATGLAIYGRF